MNPCEGELYVDLIALLGPALAPSVARAVVDQLPAAAICMISRTLKDHYDRKAFRSFTLDPGQGMAQAFDAGIRGLSKTLKRVDMNTWITVLFAILGATIGGFLPQLFLGPFVGLVGAAGIGVGTPTAKIVPSCAGYLPTGTFGACCSLSGQSDLALV